MNKTCSKCHIEKDIDLFPLEMNERKFIYYRNVCKACRSYDRQRQTYKLTQEQQEALLALRRCEICGATGVRFEIDHNHETGKVRGLLCHNCNIALGQIKEKITTLNAMINYLEERN